jgi:hypothetical protein
MAALMLVIMGGASVAGIVAGGTLQGAVPDPLPASAPANEFSSARALDHIKVMAKEPHPMGSPANAAVRDYLVRELGALGLSPQVQQATAAFYAIPGLVQAGRPENVMARLPGARTGGKAFVLAAHYDSVPTGPGATDNGAAVATVLETVRALKAGPALRNDVIVLFTDGEERGLLGARAFVDEHPWARDVGVVLNLDTRGNTGPALMLETNDAGGWVVNQFAKAAPYPMTTSDSVAFFKRSGGNSDLTVYLDAGWAGLQVSSTAGISHYHGALDNLAAVDERSLQHMGSYALALTWQFGTVGLEQTRGPDQVYFNVFRYLVHYPQAWALPLAIFAVALGVAIIVIGLRRGRLRLGRLGLGLVALPVAMVAAAVVAQPSWTVLLALHPDGLWALEYRPAVIWIACASLAIAVTAGLYGAVRNRIWVFELAAGGLLWWMLLAAMASVGFPPVSYLFTWPLLFSLMGFGILLVREPRQTPDWTAFAVLIGTGIPAAFLAASAVYAITMTRELLLPHVIPLFAAGVVLMMGLLIPHLDMVGGIRRWLLPAAATALALALFLVGGVRAGFDARHPQPDTILYALNADTGQAIWASADAKPDIWTTQFIGPHPQRGSVTDYLGDVGPKLHSPAPPTTLATPQLQLLDSSGWGSADRTLRLHLTAPAGAHVIALEVTPEVAAVAIDDKSVAERPVMKGIGSAAAWTLTFWNPRPQGLDVRMQVPGAAAVHITARTGTPGLPALPGTMHRTRPPDTMAVSHDPATIEQDSSTVVSKSFTFATPAHG